MRVGCGWMRVDCHLCAGEHPRFCFRELHMPGLFHTCALTFRNQNSKRHVVNLGSEQNGHGLCVDKTRCSMLDVWQAARSMGSGVQRSGRSATAAQAAHTLTQGITLTLKHTDSASPPWSTMAVGTQTTKHGRNIHRRIPFMNWSAMRHFGSVALCTRYCRRR